MLRLIADETLKAAEQTSVFTILTNVVQDSKFIEECVELNASRRVFDFLMRNVRQDMSDQTGSQAKIVDGETKAYEVDPNFASPVQCCFMFLTNLTLTESG